MPFIDPVDNYAAVPRSVDDEAGAEWSGELDLDRGYGVLRNVRVAGPIDLTECTELELIGCHLDGVSFAGNPGIELDISRCVLKTCDLSQVRCKALRRSVLRGCRMSGTDFSGVAIEDVAFVGGAMRYGNFRMGDLTRVAFQDLTIDEMDLYDSSLVDVTFDGSELHQVTFDKCRMQRVDLRSATKLEIVAASGLSGALITDEQVMELAYLFALASGVSIERSAP